VGRIVVGVDASPHARRALAWAAAEARLRQAVLQVVHAYHSKKLGRQSTSDPSIRGMQPSGRLENPGRN